MANLDNTEREVIRAINRSVQMNKNRPIQLNIDSKQLSDITSARRFTGVQSGKNEVYTDLVFERKNTRGFNIAIKSAVFDESIERLDIIVPNLKIRFIKSVYKKLSQMGLKDGDNVPNVFGKIDERNKKKLVTGTYSVGGPIDFMYLDLPNTIMPNFDEDSGILTLPGKFVDMDEYSKDFDLYLNLQPAYTDQKFDSEIERGGVKFIYGKSESKGIADNTIVVTTKVADNGIVVNIE
jgi:hypothetical protein